VTETFPAHRFSLFGRVHERPRVGRALDQLGTITFGGNMRTFVAGTTKIDVLAQISREALELDWLVLSRFEGSPTIAHEAFRKLADRYCGKPLAAYAMASPVIHLG
jgi:hypothetical protein